MGVRHTTHPVHGVQFHPESVLTQHGYRMLDRFLHGASSRSEALPASADGGTAGSGPAEEPRARWYAP